MIIDLEVPGELTMQKVMRMIAEADDSVDNQLWVTKDGKAFISQEIMHSLYFSLTCGSAIAPTGSRDLLFCMEPWEAGQGCVGLRAAANDEWIQRIFKALHDNYPHPTSDVGRWCFWPSAAFDTVKQPKDISKT